jgi:kynurenine formamidase
MFIEMAYSLSPDAPIFPGLPHDEFTPYTRMSGGGESNTTIVNHFLHNGTHVDAPFHFYDKGKTIDRIPIEDFCYTKPLVVQKMLPKGGLLQPEDMEVCGSSLYEADILLLCTGYHALRLDHDVYMDDFPSLSVEAARLIRTELLNVKAVAIDTLSIESCRLGPQQNFSVHKTLLDSEIYQTRSVLIFEDVNMGPILKRQITRIYAFPLRLIGLDASPVSIVAEVL